MSAVVRQLLTQGVEVFRKEVLELAKVFALTFYYTVRTRWVGSSIVKQMHEVGNRSLVFVILTLGFLGAIFNAQAGFQAKRVIGDTSMLGLSFLPLLIRQLGPTITGLMVATRVGTGIAAEIGSMVVTEQVDALRMSRAQPVDYLVKPRFIACIVMLPVLTLIGILSAIGGGLLTAQSAFQVNPSTYLNFDATRGKDLAEGMLKALAFGAVIPVIAGHAGFGARGGSEGVGWATTRAVVASSLAVIFLDFLIGGAFFLWRAYG